MNTFPAIKKSRSEIIINYQFFPLFAVFFLTTLGCQSSPQSFLRFLHRDAPRPAEAQLPENATVEQIVSVVNANVGRVQSFVTNDATLSGSGLLATLRGEIAFLRPGNFRLRGSHAVTGAEIDLGKNHELSWFWMQRNEPKAVFYCRNDQCASCRFLQNLPIDPSFMIDAMGLGLLEPHLPYKGPFVVDKNHFALHLEELSPLGEKRTRVILINRLRGLPAAQRIYNRLDQLVLDASVKTYTTDPDTGITIPQSIEIRCPQLNDGKNVTVGINFGRFFLNTLDASRTDLWKLPTYKGFPPTDMMKL